MKALVTGLPRELAPLAAHSWDRQSGGWGRTDSPPSTPYRAALPSAPSCPLTSPHRDPDWPLYEQHN